MTRRLTPTEKITEDKINTLYPNVSNKDKAAIWNIVQKCRRLKIKHIVDQ